jgi:glycerol-3-phosphate acyltransferase PlsY
VLGYLFGSIPFGYIIGKNKNIDIRKFGSGNIGATNIFRKLGLKTAILVGFLDFMKSYLVAITFLSLNHIPINLRIFISISPIIGHIFPVWLKFKGGKGVSCTFALFAAIFGLKIFAIWAIIWIVLLSTTRLMSLTNLIISLSFPILFYSHFHNFTAAILGLSLTSIIWWTHRQNIKKLLNGTENKL